MKIGMKNQSNRILTTSIAALLLGVGWACKVRIAESKAKAETISGRVCTMSPWSQGGSRGASYGGVTLKVPGLSPHLSFLVGSQSTKAEDSLAKAAAIARDLKESGICSSFDVDEF